MLGLVIAAAWLLAVMAACNQRVVFANTPHWPGADGLPQVGHGKILVTNNGDDTLSWIDLDTLEVVFSQPVGADSARREGGTTAPPRPTARPSSLVCPTSFLGVAVGRTARTAPARCLAIC